MNTTLRYPLRDAIDSFEAMAAGREASRTLIITGALALNNLCDQGIGGPELMDAAVTLTNLATGGAFILDGAHRVRYGELAEAVSRHLAVLDAGEHGSRIDRQAVSAAATSAPRRSKAMKSA